MMGHRLFCPPKKLRINDSYEIVEIVCKFVANFFSFKK